MAVYEKGILGNFNGKVGTVVGAHWRGKHVMRSRPKKITTPPSPLQVLQRDKFATMVEFLNQMRWVINNYYGHKRESSSPFNLATSYHLSNAITLQGEQWKILYDKVMISKGILSGISLTDISADEGGKLLINWEDNSGVGNAERRDELLVVAYVPEMNEFVFFVKASERELRHAILEFPSVVWGKRVHLWGTFVRPESKLAASSLYLGEFVVE